MKDTRRVDFGSGLGLMGLAVFVWVLAERLPRVSQGINPGDYPKVIAAGLLVFGAILALGSAPRGWPKEKIAIGWTAVGRVALMAVMTYAYIRLLRYLGFLLLTPFFLFASLRLFGYRRLWIGVATSLAVTAACWLIFARVFQVLLPRFTLF